MPSRSHPYVVLEMYHQRVRQVYQDAGFPRQRRAGRRGEAVR
jgi:hypothetical protein